MSWHISKALMDSFESSHSSQGPAEESSAASSSDGARFALSSGSPTPQLYLPSDRMTAFSRLSRYGMTFGPLTDDLGKELLTWFRAGFPAKTSAPPAEGPDLMEHDRDSGGKWPASSAKYDPGSRSWKTPQYSLLGDLEPFSETWPRWGMTHDGEFFPLPTPERRTNVSVSGSWPTPTKRDSRTLAGSQPPKRSPKSGLPLAWVLALTMPATARHGGRLNPRWVEWLMGWPLGWTSLQPLEMAKFRLPMSSHGER
jgi:hypothetical protein